VLSKVEGDRKPELPGPLKIWVDNPNLAQAALGNRPQVPAGNEDQELTSRELLALKLLTSDLSERDIARQLFVSHSAVHGHVRSIYRKLGVSPRDGALEGARELGLIHKSLSPRLRSIPEDAGSPAPNCDPVIQLLAAEPLSVELVPAGHATGSA
jgi:DNA-binding CsgD family transcriptional regulator